MRRALACSVALLAACASQGPDDACVRPDAGVTTSCPRPAPIDPASASASWETFLPAVSQVACERGLLCENQVLLGLILFCNPSFARHQARRMGSEVLPPLDPRFAAACLDALARAPDCYSAFLVGERCLALLGPTPPSWVAAGAPCGTCEDCCVPGAICRDGTCALDEEGFAPLPPAGAPCLYGELCADGRPCVAGICDPRAGVEGDTCGSGCAGCAAMTSCERGVCELVTRRIGCSCGSDDDCPVDVSECVDRVCTSRPMLGEACPPGSPPCFGSTCRWGVCVPQPAGAICGADVECETGLVCAYDESTWGRYICQPPP